MEAVTQGAAFLLEGGQALLKLAATRFKMCRAIGAACCFGIAVPNHPVYAPFRRYEV